MGCDIHATIEYKEDWHEWYSIAKDFSIDRWYRLFSYLAGVRNSEDIKPLHEPKGMPEDASWEAKELYEEDGGGHNESWLTFEELLNLPDEFKDELFYQTMKVAAEKYGDGNVRLVFFFDN